MMSIEDIIDILAVELLGVVPDDEKIVISTNRGEPIVVDSKSVAGRAYNNIARRLAGENVPVMDLEHEDSLLLKIKRLFGLETT
jgi:septum site-determining protein MinD